MPQRRESSSQEERRRLFRRMEWVFVYAPPILAVFIAVFGAAFLAMFVPVPQTNFWGRWAAGVGLILGVPLIAYVVRAWWRGR
jgi:hypothetical protein